MKFTQKKWLLVFGLALLALVMIWRTQLSTLKVTARSENAKNTSLTPSSVTLEMQQVNHVNQSYSLATEGTTQPPQVEELTEQCIRSTGINFVSSSLLSQAKSNAHYFLSEFRKVIPQRSLSGYRSHCWKESFSAHWDQNTLHGDVGNISFSRKFKTNEHRRFLLPLVTKDFPRRQYTSSLTCLPDLFLAGFSKCGSSYLYCLINKLISVSTFKAKMNVEKEPHFWALPNAGMVYHVPTVDSIGAYLLNFLPGMRLISDSDKKDGILMDSSPNYLLDWPRFREAEDGLTNYCLIPSVLPVLLPHSKYVVIMRNPIKMLYSSFWFSCTMLGFKFSKELLLKGPDLFHERIVSKLDMFNNCMRDTSVPSISNVCELDNKHTYSSCIQQRLHLLDRCTHKIKVNIFSPELDKCGRSRVAMGLYYVHVRKWLSVVPRDRFLFLTLEELTQDYKHTAYDILTFLDLGTDLVSDKMINLFATSCNKNAQSSVDYKHNPKLQMRNDTQTLLEHFYHSFNSMLAMLLDSDKFMW